jgi:hypothetical protein
MMGWIRSWVEFTDGLRATRYHANMEHDACPLKDFGSKLNWHLAFEDVTNYDLKIRVIQLFTKLNEIILSVSLMPIHR